MAPAEWMINGRWYPNTDPIDVKPGQRVRLRLFNMSMEDHPMHLHGHSFQWVAIGGRQADGPIKDTVTIVGVGIDRGLLQIVSATFTGGYLYDLQPQFGRTPWGR